MGRKQQCVAIFLTSALASPALAAEPEPGPKAGLNEIIVTAQRRDENLQNVPIAVTAISAEALETAGIKDVADLQHVVPGLRINNSVGYGVTTLRGIGLLTIPAGEESPTAFYVDGVYSYGGAAALMALNNIQRVEVLKGPQGTLFGRNAVGGVIQIVTRDPQTEPSLQLNVGYGNYNTVEASGYATIGLSSNLAADLSVYYRDQADGWGQNLFNGQDVNKSSALAIRSKWLWQADERTDITATFGYSRSRNLVGSSLRAEPGKTLFDGTSYPGFYNSNVNFDGGPTQFESYNTSLRIGHDMDWARLQSITSYQRYIYKAVLDGDATPTAFINNESRIPQSVWTQEVQLVSPKSSPVSWLVGALYLHDQLHFDPVRASGSVFSFIGVGPGQSLLFDTRQKLSSYSAFGQVTWPILSGTRLTGGLRYTSDKRGISSQTLLDLGVPGVSPIGFPPSVPQSKTFGKLTYKVALDHDITQDLMVFASYSRGFKSGVFNPLDATAPPVEPSVLDSYELGVKSEWFDRHLRINLSAYHYDYNNMQVRTTSATTGLTVTANAAKATIDGADLEIEAIITPRFSVRGSVSYLDAKFTDYPNAPINVPNQVFPPFFGNVQIVGDATGNPLPFSPDWTVNLGAQYAIPTDIGEFSISANGTYSGRQVGFDFGGRVYLPSSVVVNSVIDWHSPDKKWSVSLWANNLFNERYLNFLSAEAVGDQAIAAAPRTFGIRIGVTIE